MGYTSGLFDLFHAGDLDLLRRARAECGHLTVGVISDELAADTWGVHPYIPLRERMEILEHVRFVDRVVALDTIDLAATWAELRFHVLFPGMERNGSPSPEQARRELAGTGVRVVPLPGLRDTRSAPLRNALARNIQWRVA